MTESIGSGDPARLGRLESLLASVRSAVLWEYDPAIGAITFLSGGDDALLGYSADEWRASGFWRDHLHPDDASWAPDSILESTRRGADHDLTYRMLRKDGSVAWVRDSVVADPASNGDGPLRGLLVDISGQRAAEIALENSERLYRQVVEASGSIAIRTDADRRLTYVSAAALELVGLGEDDVLGRDFTDFLPSDLRDAMRAQFAERMDGAVGSDVYTLPIASAVGDDLTVELLAGTILGGDGRPCGVVAIGRDVTDRELARRELSAKAEEFDAVFELTRDTYFRIDADGVICDCKSSAPDLLGESPEALLGRRLTEVLPKSAAEIVDEGVKEARRSGDMSLAEYELDSGGRRSNFAARFLPLVSGNTLVVVRDITFRRRREQEVAESRDFLQRLLGMIDAGVMVVDAETFSVSSANAPAETMFGWGSGEMIGTSVAELLAGDADTTAIFAQIRHRLRSRESYRAELVMQRRDGQPFEAEMTVRIIWPRDREYIVVVRDVTERNSAERRILENELRFRHVVEGAPFGMCFFDLRPDGRLVLSAVNPAAERMVAAAGGARLWADVGDALPGLSPSAVEAFRRVAVQGGEWSSETVVCTDDGSPHMCAMTAFQASPSTLAVTLSDVTEKRLIEERERSYLARLSALTAEIGRSEERQRRHLAEELHDRVSQPLAVARLHLDAALEDSNDDSELFDVLHLLDQAIRESRSVTTQLSPPMLYELGVGAALNWLCKEFRRAHALECNSTICSNVAIDDDTAAVLFRSARELLMNVVKHARTQTAWLSLDALPGTVVLTVEDQGLGFDPDTAASNADAEGFGLFSIVQRVRYLGGTLDLASEPGRGTRVTIELPLKPAVP